MRRSMFIALVVLLAASSGWTNDEGCSNPRLHDLPLALYPGGGDFEFTVTPGCHQVKFSDLLPGAVYRMAWEMTVDKEALLQPVGAFSDVSSVEKKAPDGGGEKPMDAILMDRGRDLKATVHVAAECRKLREARLEFLNLTKESALPLARPRLEVALARCEARALVVQVYDGDGTPLTQFDISQVEAEDLDVKAAAESASKAVIQALDLADEQARNQVRDQVEDLLIDLHPKIAGKLSEVSLEVARARAALAAPSEMLSQPHRITPGSTLKVTLTKVDGSDNPKTWTLSLRVERRWEWTPSYGFMFIPNNDDRFYQAANPDGDGFVLREKDDSLGFDFAAAVMYTYRKRLDTEKWWCSLGVTGGLGFDLSDPVVFAGVTYPATTNIGLHAGVVMHKQKRLRGEYDLESIVNDQLDEDQLHEKTYEPNWYIGLSFRFGSPPETHKNKKSPETE